MNLLIKNRLPALALDKNRKRVKLCPCGKSNKDGKFVPFANYEDKGYCHSCGERFMPEIDKSEHWQNPFPVSFHLRQRKQETTKKPASNIPKEVFKSSLKFYESNHFISFLNALFEPKVINNVIGKYFIGTSKRWEGATVFWYIDSRHQMRSGKIMLYDSITGKRIKEPYNYIDWVHTALKLPEFTFQQCFFGEQLLNDKTKWIAIFESEKTAIIASVFFPELICISCGGAEGLTAKKCEVLKGRNVILFPDLNKFEAWKNRASELSHIANFQVSDLLERICTIDERKVGLDLADYLIRYKWQDFVNAKEKAKENLKLSDGKGTQISANPIQIKPIETRKEVAKVIEEKPAKPESWEQDISELETYFAGIQLPTKRIKLNQYTTIENITSFIDNHLATVKNYDGNKTFMPYLNRLQELRNHFLLPKYCDHAEI